MQKNVCLAVFLLTWLAATGSALAQEPVGYVKTLKGSATITTAGSTANAAAGSSIFQGSQIQTGKESSLGLTFKDNTVMAFGPDTKLTVDDYVFNPNQGQVKFGSSLTRGTLNFVSGAIAKLNPEAVAIKTPSGTIGVRGTNFVVKVEGEE